MHTSLELLSKARTLNQNDAHWCRVMEVSSTTLSVAEHRGRLSPVVAGNLARLLGEDEEHWIAVAALEAAPESKAKKKLAKTVLGSIKKL